MSLEIIVQKNVQFTDILQLTWADISVFENVSNLTDKDSPTFSKRLPWFDQEKRMKFLDKFPLLKSHMARVSENPGIKKWLSERPANDEEPF